MNNKELKNALAHLSADLKMKAIIETFESPFWPETPVSFFESSVESIVSQQLSVKAADAIYKRFLKLYGGKFPTAREILATDDEKMRACGISRPKIKYIKGLAEMVDKNEIDLDALTNSSDQEVINKLVTVKGIGQWTAEMLLIFDLRRPDVFSYGDLGLRNAIAKTYDIDRDDLISMEKIVNPWSPYRSLAARYLWKSLDSTTKKQIV